MTEQLLIYNENSDIQELETNINDLTTKSRSVDYKIIQENNKDVRTLATELELLKDVFLDSAYLIFGQGENLQTAEANIEKALADTETATDNLEQTENLTKHSRGKLFDACMLIGGVGLGALGWIGGPWIGIPTMVAGLGLSGSVVLVRNKLQKDF